MGIGWILRKAAELESALLYANHLQVVEDSAVYSRAGVDIAAGDRLAERLGKLPETAGALGGFAAVLDLPTGLTDPVMVACCDGVGTKLKLLNASGRLRTAGIDLVAMCVNDLVCCGATPAYFLDYYGCAHLDEQQAAEVIESIAAAAAEVGCRLAGGETAELPGLFAGREFDLAGFAVGFAERAQLLGAGQVRENDALIALAATGPHSNGFSLIRKIIAERDIDIEAEQLDGKPLAEALLAPTALYVQAAERLRKAGGLHAMAHITGGGLAGNLARVIPDELSARIDGKQLSLPPVFRWLAEAGAIDDAQLRRVFNCGIGMVAIVAANQQPAALASMNEIGVEAWPIGTIGASSQEGPKIVID